MVILRLLEEIIVSAFYVIKIILRTSCFTQACLLLASSVSFSVVDNFVCVLIIERVEIEWGYHP
jgi:hypothetical protein